MARKKNNSKKGHSKRKKDEEEFEDESEKVYGLRDDTKYWIGVIVVLVVGTISFLALFDLAGVVGQLWSRALTRLFGWGDFLIPFLLLWVGWVLVKRRKHVLHHVHYWGIGLFVLSFYALLHWTQVRSGLVVAIAHGKGGGYVGLLLSWLFANIFGVVAGAIVLVALLIISVLLLFDASTHALFGEYSVFYRMFVGFKNSINTWRYRDEEELYDESCNESNGEQEHNNNSEGATEREHEGTVDSDIGEYEDGVSIHDIDGQVLIDSHIPTPGEQGVLVQTPRRRMSKIDIPLALLSNNRSQPNSGDIRAHQDIIKRTLETFGIDVTMGEVNVGPTVTQYTFRPAEGVKVNQITTLQNDLALALAAHSIRIEAPIPGKSLVGLEIPNETAALVTLKELLTSPLFKRKLTSHLTLPLGKDVAGNTYLADLDTMPHLLIAGATGSGKSIAINTLLVSLMYQNQPTDLKFILIDPKRVELSSYNDIPYLITPVITDAKKTVGALKWAVNEMDRRYVLLSRSGHRHLANYNKHVDANDTLAYIVIVIDELADLMSVAAADIEASIVRLAQMARAVGIHLIVATQRPSVDVITGLIKANITSRVAFNVASVVDSRTILDSSGAEKLLGRGDMLFTSAELPKPKRIQGAFISDKEISALTSFLRKKAKPEYLEEVGTIISPSSPSGSGGLSGLDSDELIEEAREVILSAGKASASLLQRRLRVGYARAARILDILEDMGFIGPADGSKPREILEESNNNEDGGSKEYYNDQDDSTDEPDEQSHEDEGEGEDEMTYDDEDENDEYELRTRK